jgi:hypothetical protein
MDQDSSDNSSDDPFSDSGLPQEEVISTAEKVCLSVPSEVSIEKEIVWKVLTLRRHCCFRKCGTEVEDRITVFRLPSSAVN